MMKKSAVIALFAFAMLPFSACSNNNEQSAYMTSPKAEENAREAEQAEQEFAQLTEKQDEAVHGHKDGKKSKSQKSTSTKVAKKDATKKTGKTPKGDTPAEAVAKSEKTTPKTESREPASVKEETAHHAVQHSMDGQKSWTVQLGAFKVKENAEKLTAKLKTEGFPAMMVGKDGSKTGELYLVHLEPTPNKSEAEKWQTDLKLKSFDSTLTAHRD